MDHYSKKITPFAIAASPPEWAGYADELKAAADLLWCQQGDSLVVSSDVYTNVSRRPLISRAYILLAGFALENILKGLIVAHNPIHVRGGKLSKQLRSHRLSGLAVQAHLQLTRAEAHFCDLVEEALVYWARYPIPLSADDMRLEQAASETHHRAFKRLFARARKSLYRKMKGGWDSGEGHRLVSYYDSAMEPHGKQPNKALQPTARKAQRG